MIEIFNEDSPFVTDDNRRHRPRLATSAASLNNRHSLLFPKHVVAEATVLDLGCCLGATGHWALTLGASGYLGVEHQELYAEQAAGLLSRWPTARVTSEDVTSFTETDRTTYDVVAMLGILHGVFNPLSLIQYAADKAVKYLCIEAFGMPSPQPTLMVRADMHMPVAGELAARTGFGWYISPAAMNAMLGFLGFSRDMEPVFLLPDRWLCRYVRSGKPSKSASYSDVKWPWTQQP